MTEQRFFTETIETPTGAMRLVTDEQDAVRSLDWDDHAQRMHRLMRLHYGVGGVRLDARSAASPARRAIEAYFEGELAALDTLAVKTGGTDFQRQVWAALRTIGVGQRTTYGRVAALLGRAKAVRAVGLANGSNPVAIIVPCHRVIGADGSLTGYGGGLERKRWLLEHESAWFGLAEPARRESQAV